MDNQAQRNEHDLDRIIDSYCYEWVNWCGTRKFYIPKQAATILGRMQPSKVRQPPNARNLPDMQHFNHAVAMLYDIAFSQPVIKSSTATQAEKDAFEKAMAERQRKQIDYMCFIVHYDPQHKILVKRAAADLGIAPRTYYNNIKRFAHAAYSLMQSLKRVHAAQQVAV